MPPRPKRSTYSGGAKPGANSTLLMRSIHFTVLRYNEYMKLTLIATIEKPEKPETEDKPLILTTPSEINLYRTKMNMVAIKTYLSHGVLMTRTHTPKRMLALATEITGKPYKYINRTLRVVLAEALKDLEEATDPYFKQASEAMGLGMDITIKDLIDSIKGHDYTYMYSDDSSQYEKGSKNADRISKLIKTLVVDLKINSDELLNRCLAVAPQYRLEEGEVEGRAHKQIRAWFKGALNNYF